MITLTILNGPTFSVPYTKGMNVEQAMQGAFNNQTNAIFTYNTQYYGTILGNLVTMINETYESFPALNSYNPFYYWELLINNVPAISGINNTILNDNDIVTFELTFYSTNSIPTHSTLHAKHSYKTNSIN
jgi:hypothetical protein